MKWCYEMWGCCSHRQNDSLHQSKQFELYIRVVSRKEDVIIINETVINEWVTPQTCLKLLQCFLMPVMSLINGHLRVFVLRKSEKLWVEHAGKSPQHTGVKTHADCSYQSPWHMDGLYSLHKSSSFGKLPQSSLWVENWANQRSLSPSLSG